MPLRVQCSAGHLMMVPDHRAGTVLRCPNCGIDVQVPPAGGIAGKELVKPRITTPVIARNDAKTGAGPAARQSPQVAGHSTAAKAAVSLPALNKPAVKPRVKPAAPAPVAADKAASPEQIAEPIARKKTEETTTIVRPAADPPPAPVAPIVSAPPEQMEVVFTTPVIAAPKPLISKKTPAVDPAATETVELPPRKIIKQAAEEKPAPTAPAIPKSSRQTLTGTVIAPAPEPEPISPPTELFEIKDEPEPPPEPVLAPPIAAPGAQPVADELEPEPAAPPVTVLLGVRPTDSQRHTTWQLAAALAATALLSIGPALWEIVDFMQYDSGPDVARWAFLLLMCGVVQLATIVLLVQVPDWSSVWIVTLQSLGFAAIYAAILGLTAITNGDSSLIDTLQLGEQYSSNKAPAWCICLAATYACIAFFAGRISAKWHKMLRQIQASEQAAAHA